MSERFYSIDAIRDALADRNLTMVAEKTGLHRETLYNIVNRRQDGMSFKTYKILIKYLFDGGE